MSKGEEHASEVVAETDDVRYLLARIGALEKVAKAAQRMANIWTDRGQFHTALQALEDALRALDAKAGDSRP